MKLLVFVLLMSTSAFAQRVIKVTDGGVALCNNEIDYLRYKTSTVVRLLDIDWSMDQAEVKVEFLKCMKEGETYKFVRDNNIAERVTTLEPGPLSQSRRLVKLQRENLSAVAYRSDTTRFHSHEALTNNGDNTYSASMPFNGRDELELDRNGEKFFELSISTKVKLIDMADDHIIDSKLEFMGSYRVYVE